MVYDNDIMITLFLQILKSGNYDIILPMREEIKRKLKEKAEKDYKEFNTKLIPGIDKKSVMGVRMPDVRALAKQIAKEDFRKFMDEMDEAENPCYEEKLIYGMVIGYAKINDDERFDLIRRFVPYIDNWALCDSVDSTYRFIRKDPEKGFDFLKTYLDSDREFEKRFGTVMLLAHYVNNDDINEVYLPKVIEEMKLLGRDQPYYAMMAVAWTLSVCYIKNGKLTVGLLSGDGLDHITRKKTIQKIRESFRVSEEEKENLKKLIKA